MHLDLKNVTAHIFRDGKWVGGLGWGGTGGLQWAEGNLGRIEVF